MEPEEHEEVEEYPNMLFVPLKKREHVVSAREFLVYIVLLVSFMLIVGNQYIATDFLVNDGLQGMCGMTQFRKISTTEDYVSWWPVLFTAIKQWHRNADPAIDAAAQGLAVLVGMPLITQKRKILEHDSLSSNELPGFDAAGQPCAWSVPAGGACYQSSLEVRDHGLVYLMPQIKMMLNDTITGWTPANWIDQDTQELSHRITLYMPASRRFATIDISLAFDMTGRLTLYSAAGEPPQFHSHEPYQLATGPIDFWAEVFFYAIVIWFMIGEFAEIWDCICLTDLVLPIGILADVLELGLCEVQHSHELTTEVYDPRNPKTGEAFEFPDLEDIQKHHKEYIVPLEQEADAYAGELLQLKARLAGESKSSIRDKSAEGLRTEMQEQQHKMMLHDIKLKLEIELSEMATALQLSVMWKNKWSMEFPQNYLTELAGTPIKGTGVDAFSDVNWIFVARQYIIWKAGAHAKFAVPKTWLDARSGDRERNPGPLESSFLKHHFRASRIFHQHGDHIRSSKKSAAPKQHQHFAHLVILVDYLKMVRSLLTLHINVVVARDVKYWGGPRGKGVVLSNTCNRAFQGLVERYNQTGRNVLGQMETFPDEISDGFHTPNQNKADTVVIRARAVQARLMRNIQAASVLGFYFPGSPLWELRRKLRRLDLVKKSESFWKSLRLGSTSAMGLVSGSSMTLYVQADDVTKESDAVSPRAPPKQAAAKGSKGMQYSNPLQQSGVSNGSSDDEDGDEVPTSTITLPASYGSYDSIDSDTVFTEGMEDWSRLLSFHIRSLVNMDGQFIQDDSPGTADAIAKYATRIPVLLPLLLWLKYGLATYVADMWNSIEFVTYLLFILAFYCKIQMHVLASQIESQYEATMAGDELHMSLLDDYSDLNWWYMFTMMPNGLLMWIKLFKYVEVIPQMGVLIKVLSQAIGPVLIFTLTAMIPCVGLALSYHAKFGATVKNYSTVLGSLNTLMRMAVGVSNTTSRPCSASAGGRGPGGGAPPPPPPPFSAVALDSDRWGSAPPA
jgi:hypothetical protein